MPINGMMALMAGSSAVVSTAYRYDLAGYTLTPFSITYPIVLNISSITLNATTGGPPSIVGSNPSGSSVVGNWHSSGSVTAPIRDGAQMRLSYVSGVNSYVSGPALGTWVAAAAGTPPAYSWGWYFTSGGGSGGGSFLLELRDPISLAVYDSATISVTV